VFQAMKNSTFQKLKSIKRDQHGQYFVLLAVLAKQIPIPVIRIAIRFYEPIYFNVFCITTKKSPLLINQWKKLGKLGENKLTDRFLVWLVLKVLLTIYLAFNTWERHCIKVDI